VDTLEELSERLGESAELWFVLGIDAARELPRWHQVERVLALTQLGVVGRPGYTLDLAAMERALPSIRDRVHQIDGLRLDISSTDLRSRLADGRPVRYQIPEPVRAYIAQHGLYRDDDSA
jgi:nicotinate-nucleotide adenylyltransferase